MVFANIFVFAKICAKLFEIFATMGKGIFVSTLVQRVLDTPWS
jgi:hypothetical protein